jgi:probable F420-dependent oxidoreductase
MKFTVSTAFSQLDQLTELARAAEEHGYASIALPDSIFYSEKVAADYPYTADGARFWDEHTPWVDPLVATAAMGAVTNRIRFYPQVLKLGPRSPVLLARQIGSVAHLTGNRFGLGVGIGWTPEEFEWCGAPFAKRGKRVDEAIEVLKLILGGGMVEYHGEHFDFDKLQMSPAPTEPVPFYVGGHTEVGLKRAARIGDGWTSAMMTFEELRTTIARLTELRAEYGRLDEPFEIQAVCTDRFGLDGYRELAEIGVTDAIVVPWAFYGVDFGGDLAAKKDGIARFAHEVIEKF